jgi:hypothetical protein
VGLSTSLNVRFYRTAAAVMPNKKFVAYQASLGIGHGILVPNNFARVLIFPEPEKHRLTQPIIASPRPVAGRLKNGQDSTAILFISSDRPFQKLFAESGADSA